MAFKITAADGDDPRGPSTADGVARPEHPLITKAEGII
jgi:hypothetical protein